jgi:hypothetical protein
VLRIINEPTAASLAYGLDKKGNETILVFDLGGGTFDVSVLEVGDGVFEVLSTSGDTHLGGDDFDKRIVDWLAGDFQTSEGIDLRKDRQALQRLTEAAEKAKIDLSATPTTTISLPFITATAEGPKHIETSLSRAKFEQLAGDLLERVRLPVEAALRVRQAGGAWMGEAQKGWRAPGLEIPGWRAPNGEPRMESPGCCTMRTCHHPTAARSTTPSPPPLLHSLASGAGRQAVVQRH